MCSPNSHKGTTNLFRAIAVGTGRDAGSRLFEIPSLMQSLLRVGAAADCCAIKLGGLDYPVHLKWRVLPPPAASIKFL